MQFAIELNGRRLEITSIDLELADEALDIPETSRFAYKHSRSNLRELDSYRRWLLRVWKTTLQADFQGLPSFEHGLCKRTIQQDVQPTS